MKCPKCNHKNKRNDKRCTICGAELNWTFKELFRDYNQRYNLNIILPITVLFVIIFMSGFFIAANSSFPNPSPAISDIPSKTYDNQEFSFKYPENWTIIEKKPDSFYLMYLDIVDSNSKNQSNDAGYDIKVEITKKDLPFGQTLKGEYDSTYRMTGGDPTFHLVSESTLIIDGSNAYQRIETYTEGGLNKQLRTVWMEKNGKIYIFECSSPQSDFEAQNKNFDLIIYSFHFK